MKPVIYQIIVTALIFISTSCAGPQKPVYRSSDYNPPAQESRQPETRPEQKPAHEYRTETPARSEGGRSSYQDAVQKIGARLAVSLNHLAGGDTTRKTFFIFNKDVQNGVERELAARFIEDLRAVLVKNGITIRRKEMFTWKRATGQAPRIECSEVLEEIASDFLMSFSLRECTDFSECVEILVEVGRKDTNIIEYTEKESCRLTGNLTRLYHQKRNVPQESGTLENPYADYNEAANFMAGRLSCIIKDISSQPAVIVGKTDNTPCYVAVAFSQSLAYYGIAQVVESCKWMPVVIRTGDQFEMGFYNKKHREKFETADMILNLDIEDKGRGMYNLSAQLQTLRSIEIKQNQILRAGMVVPHGAVDGVFKGSLRLEPADSKHRENDDRPRISKQEKQNPSERPDAYKPEKTAARQPERPDKTSDAYKQGQTAMLRNLNRSIRERLQKDGISAKVANLVYVQGSIDNPDCRKEDHYLQPKGVPPRNYCEMNYDIRLILDNKEICYIESRAHGSGSSRDYAWDDALMEIGEHIYPLISDIAFTMSEEKSLQSLRSTLESLGQLDETYWRINQDFNVDTLMGLIERMIESI